MRNRALHLAIVSVALQLAMACTLQAGIITNITESGTGQTGPYAIVASVADGGPGLQDGSLEFLDRSYVWTGPDTGPMASYLVGLEYVMTRNDDKNVPDLTVDFTFGELANVFLLDFRAVSVPVTGATFTTVGTNEIASTHPDAPFNLRKAMVAPGTTITVIGRDSLMWGLAVQPVPEPSTLLLFSLGAAGLFAGRRKRRR